MILQHIITATHLDRLANQNPTTAKTLHCTSVCCEKAWWILSWSSAREEVCAASLAMEANRAIKSIILTNPRHLCRPTIMIGWRGGRDFGKQQIVVNTVIQCSQQQSKVRSVIIFARPRLSPETKQRSVRILWQSLFEIWSRLLTQQSVLSVAQCCIPA